MAPFCLHDIGGGQGESVPTISSRKREKGYPSRLPTLAVVAYRLPLRIVASTMSAASTLGDLLPVDMI